MNMEQTVDKIFDETYILNTIRRKKMEENRENIEIELSDEDFMKLARMAHEQDITLNDLFNIILKNAMEELEVKKDLKTVVLDAVVDSRIETAEKK